jgi:hypothetical protein
MGVAATHGKMVAASKHGFSFGVSVVTALAFLLY